MGGESSDVRPCKALDLLLQRTASKKANRVRFCKIAQFLEALVAPRKTKERRKNQGEDKFARQHTHPWLEHVCLPRLPAIASASVSALASNGLDLDALRHSLSYRSSLPLPVHVVLSSSWGRSHHRCSGLFWSGLVARRRYPSRNPRQYDMPPSISRRRWHSMPLARDQAPL